MSQGQGKRQGWVGADAKNHRLRQLAQREVTSECDDPGAERLRSALRCLSRVIVEEGFIFDPAELHGTYANSPFELSRWRGGLTLVPEAKGQSR